MFRGPPSVGLSPTKPNITASVVVYFHDKIRFPLQVNLHLADSHFLPLHQTILTPCYTGYSATSSGIARVAVLALGST